MDMKIATVIEAVYEAAECAIVINSQLTEWFRIRVKHDCLLSHILFSMWTEFGAADLKRNSTYIPTLLLASYM